MAHWEENDGLILLENRFFFFFEPKNSKDEEKHGECKKWFAEDKTGNQFY